LRTYYGYHTGKPGPQKVIVNDDGNKTKSKYTYTMEGEKTELKHVVSHSPDGLNWGYDGSGPSDLALSILEDVTGDHNLSMRLHVPFREQYVSAWGLYWVLFEQEVLDWIDKQDHEEH
jgi:hypothetical protein